MKREILFTAIICGFSLVTSAQNDGIKLDVLKAPVSPASNLLGIATTDIDKPTDVSSFMLSLQSASSSFTRLPSNYAVDISPYYLFSKKKGDYTTSGLQSKNFKDIFKQTFIISTAVLTPDSSETSLNPNSTYAGLGFKFSIFRGKYDDETVDKLSQITTLQKRMTDSLTAASREWRKKNDPEYLVLLVRRETMVANKTPSELAAIINSDEYNKITNEISAKLQQFTDSETSEVKEEIFNNIKKVAATFQTARIGFSWDINGGISGEFIDKRFDNSKLYNAGIWTNFGYTNKKGIAFLGLIRYLYNPDKVFALDNINNKNGNISTLDGGFRLAYSEQQSRFSGSIESVYRSVLSSQTIDPSWRLVLNADYAIFQNQKLTFSFGRNFDQTITKSGNLIAALTFLTGFGNKR